MRSKIMILAVCMMMSVFASCAFAASLTISIGSYDTDVYVNSDFTVPVTIISDNVTGNVQVTIAPKDGLTCKQPATCSNTLSFTASGSKDTSFILTAAMTGTYTSPFTITASSGGTSASPATGSSTISVSEQPSWTITFTSNNLTTRQVSAGQSIVLDLGISVTNTIEGVVANLSLPSGWSLTGGSQSYDIGTVTATETAQWTVKANNPGADQTIYAYVSSTNPVKSATKYIKAGTNPTSGTTTTTTVSTTTTTISGSPGAGPGSGPSGGPAATTTTLQKQERYTHRWTVMEKEQKHTMIVANRTAGLKQITIQVRNRANNVMITITKMDGHPAQVTKQMTGNVYRYMEINAFNISDTDIENASIGFEVEKTWLNQNRLDKNRVYLYRYSNNEWVRLRTRFMSENSTHAVYEADTPGFSYFAISAEPVSTTTTQTTGPVQTTTTVSSPFVPTFDYSLFIVIALLVIVLFIAIIKRDYIFEHMGSKKTGEPAE